jgi:hypothetical protein
VPAGFARATHARTLREEISEENASAPIAAAAAAGQPRVRGIRALREEERSAPALIAEGSGRVRCRSERVRVRVGVLTTNGF